MNNTPLPHSDQVTINDQLAQHLETLHSDLNLGKASRQCHMTVLFYAAVHWVEEQFQQKNTRHPSAIRHAKSVCTKYGPTKRPAIRAYLQLEHFSRQARYDGWIPTDQDLQDAKNYLKHVKTDIV